MSTVRASWFSLALTAWGLASLGCTDLLGLNGLTFEEAASDPGGAAIDAGIDPDARISVGGDAASPVVDEQRYPALLGRWKTIVGRPDHKSDPPYVVYDPATGHVESHYVDVLRNRYEIIERWAWDRDWSVVYQVPRTEGTMLIGYDADLGLAEHVPTDDGVARLHPGEVHAGTPGWTDVVPIETSDGWQALAYSQDSGHYRFGRALLENEDATEVLTGTWPDAWTLLVSHPLEQGAAVLKYNADTGDSELEQLDGPADEVGNTWRGNLGGGWTSIATYPVGEGVLVLLYEAEQGRAETGTLDLSDSLSFVSAETSTWREGISHVVPLRLEADPYTMTCAMTYSESTGVAVLRTVIPLEEPTATVM